MYTEYWLDRDGEIYGPDGPIDHRIENKTVLKHKYETDYYLQDGKIFNNKGYTGYWIEDRGIYGPDKNLPWKKKN